MAQRPIRKSYPLVLPYLVPHDPVDVRAIARITSGGGNWEWQVMNWFVRWAQDDLGNISAGELLNLQEELVALVRTSCRLINAEPPKLSQVKQLQHDISGHLNELLERGQTLFSPIQIRSFIFCPKKAFSVQGRLAQGRPAPPPRSPDVVHWNVLQPKNPSQLVKTSALHLFNQSLKQHADSIGRCAHCARIFLQLRRNAHYCNRQCQSVAAMRAIRARKKQKKAGSKRAHLKGSRAQRKESKHG